MISLILLISAPEILLDGLHWGNLQALGPIGAAISVLTFDSLQFPRKSNHDPASGINIIFSC